MDMSNKGRGLLEMIGVLALISLLTIGSIAGFRGAIDKYQANQIINELTGRALTVSVQLIRGELDPSLDETANFNYPVSVQVNTPGYFQLVLSNIESRICRQILKSNWQMPHQIRVGQVIYMGQDNICEGADENSQNEMVFEFYTDLLGNQSIDKTCRLDSDCTACEECTENKCRFKCEAPEKCLLNYETGNLMCCASKNQAGDYCCPQVIDGLCCTELGACCPSDNPLIGKDGKCHACDESKGILVSSLADCSVCPNRKAFIGLYAQNICAIKCPLSKPLQDEQGRCFACDDPTEVVVTRVENHCQACPDRQIKWAVGGNKICVLKGVNAS